MNKEKKIEIIKNFAVTPNDTGSMEVQIALLTERIVHLNNHCAQHRKDNATKMGLLKLVGRRRSFLRYLQHKDVEKYEGIIARLNLRK